MPIKVKMHWRIRLKHKCSRQNVIFRCKLGYVSEVALWKYTILDVFKGHQRNFPLQILPKRVTRFTAIPCVIEAQAILPSQSTTTNASSYQPYQVSSLRRNFSLCCAWLTPAQNKTRKDEKSSRGVKHREKMVTKAKERCHSTLFFNYFNRYHYKGLQRL